MSKIDKYEKFSDEEIVKMLNDYQNFINKHNNQLENEIYIVTNEGWYESVHLKQLFIYNELD